MVQPFCKYLFLSPQQRLLVLKFLSGADICVVGKMQN